MAARGSKAQPGITTGCGRPRIGACGRTPSFTTFTCACCGTFAMNPKASSAGPGSERRPTPPTRVVSTRLYSSVLGVMTVVARLVFGFFSGLFEPLLDGVLAKLYLNHRSL